MVFTNRIMLIAVLTVTLSGCGLVGSSGPPTETQMQDIRLNDVGELYRAHQESYKKPPKSLNDFIKLGDASAPTGFEALRNKQVIVRWNATLPDTSVEPTSPPSDQVLAYVKDVPERGGAVMMLDRRIRHMTPEQFKAAKLAGSDDPSRQSKAEAGSRSIPR